MSAFFVRVVWALAMCLMCAVAVIRWRDARRTFQRHSLLLPSQRRLAADSLDTITDAAEIVIANDPFRLANAPSTTRYDPTADETTGSWAPPVVVRPVLTLKAIVGPPWQALVDGIPGQPAGAIVRTGGVFDKLVARTVTRDSVVIQGPDTAWVLSFRAPRHP